MDIELVKKKVPDNPQTHMLDMKQYNAQNTRNGD
jgi:hypothetical protein